jgi:hypothetical protein
MVARLAFDCHLHFYPGYDPERFFRALDANLGGAAGGTPLRLALLTEAPGCAMFPRWAAPGARLPGAYSFAATAEPHTLELLAKGRHVAWIVSGRQIVTGERLEVLTAGAFPAIEDGRPLAGVVEALTAAGALAIIPWGAGKWLGSRRRLLERIASAPAAPGMFLADNPARPVFWPAPRAFRLMELQGRPVLRGSDPLPLPGEEERAGAFASVLEGEFDPARPLASLRKLLEAAAGMRALGRQDGVLSFFRRQIGLRLRS